MRNTLLAAGLALALGLATPLLADPVKPFNGKNLDGWKLRGNDAKKNAWKVGTAALDAKDPAKLVVRLTDPPPADLVNERTGVDLYTAAEFGDCKVALDLMVPKGSNSGVYLMGEYEVQILDSHGKEKVGTGDLGGIYATSAPKTNAARKPGEWQTLVIEFQAPRFKDGKKVKNATFVKVTLNGTVIQENVEVKGPTPACLTGKEKAKGPVLFQGDHGPVAFRNIVITPAAAAEKEEGR